MSGIAHPSGKKADFNLSVHGLRGVATMAVFLFHIYDMSRKLNLVPETMPVFLKASLVSLSAGVDLFFMISGYLITASLIRHVNVRAFLFDRFARIYPVFLFLHVILFCAAPFAHYKWMDGISLGDWTLHFFSNLLFLPGVFNLPLLQLNAWSLSYEFLFYFIAAAVYLFWSKRRWLSYALLALVIPALIWVYPRAAFFAVGTAVFFLSNKAYTKIDVRAWPRAGWFGFVGFMAIMAACSVIGGERTVWLAVPVGFWLFLDVVCGAPGLAKFLQHKATLFMGTISYSFYLWHPVVTYPLKFITATMLVGKMGMTPAAAIAVFGLVSTVLTVAASYVSWLILEQKGGRWLKARLVKLGGVS